MPYLRYFSDFDAYQNTELPFNVRLNFSRLFEYWEKMADTEDVDLKKAAQKVLMKLEKAPELRGPIKDYAVIEKYSEEVKLLFKPIFSPLTTTNEVMAVSMPFHPIWFNLTERFQQMLDTCEDMSINQRSYDADMMYIGAASFFVNYKYGANITYKKPLFFDVKDEKKKVTRHYRALINADFSGFKETEKFNPLSDEDIAELKNNFDDVELWKEKVPPGSVDYEGFGIMKLFDVTEAEALASLEFELLKKDALSSPEIIDTIKNNIESILNLSDLKIGFATYTKEFGMLKSMGNGLWNSMTLSDKESRPANSAFCSYSFPIVFDQKTPYAIPEIRPEHIGRDPLVKQMVRTKIESYIAFPLVYSDEIVGIFELGSTTKCALNSVVAKSLEEVIPIFATALKRTQDEYETKLDSIVQEKCTAIHPAVSWRFFEAAENLLKNRKLRGNDEMEEIVFPKVYPLYGQSDIKGSSTARNNGIQQDMIEHLNIAKKTLQLAINDSPLPILKALKLKITKNIKKMRKGLSAGDEISVLDFLKREIYPVFKHLETLNPQMQKAVKDYRNQLDPELGVIYKRRKAYEQTVTQINQVMGAYLDKAQEEAQAMFPHYFEKYKTDGVEHNIYIGESMVKNRTFDPLYLKNLRLWQLMVICESENLIEKLKPEMAAPLSVASLVLVHSNPITIKFSQEEKQFDVDGAYNVRYEIIKKRIDKAIVNGTTERLTQSGKIAIVYSQEKEVGEYLPLLEYLQSINYIGPKIEYLNLQDMQGVKGMKALRVSVVYENAAIVSKSSELVKQKVMR